MGVETQEYIRKPLYVKAVRVTEANFDELVAWCQGEELSEEMGGKQKKYIKVRVHHPTKNPRQTKAFVGDWLLYTEFGGYKVYTNKAFRATFDLVTEEDRAGSSEEQPRSLYSPKDEGGLAEPLRAASPETVARANEEANGAATGADPEFEGMTKPHTIADAKIHDVTVVAEEPSPATGVQPIESVEAAVDAHTTPQGEPHEYIQASPGAIAAVVNEQEQARQIEEQAEPIPEQPPEVAAAGKRVLSEEEQRQMGPDAVRELVQAGEVVLAQDLAA